MDWESEGARTLSPYLHRRGIVGTVLCLEAYLAACRSLRAGRSLRFAAGEAQLQTSLCCGVDPGADRADIPLYRTLVLLKGNNLEEVSRRGCIYCFDHPGMGCLQDCNVIYSFDGL